MRVIEVFTDDLDGGKADGTVHFALDGTAYEIDLSEANAARLRETLKPYVEAGRPVAKAAKAPRRAVSRGVSPAEIRTWARANGYKVNERGRIPADVVAAYHASREG
jgi:hypothetical protein